MESPLYKVIIIGTKIEPSRELLRSHEFKGVTQDVDIAKNKMRLQRI